MTFLRAVGEAFMTALAIGCVWLLAMLIAGCRGIETVIP